MNIMIGFTRFLAIPAMFVCSAAAFGQYKAESAGAPPTEIAAGISGALQKDGIKITNNGKAYCEIWLRTEKPTGAASSEENQTLKAIPQGALLGVIRFDGKGQDRRGQGIQPGVYTLRYALIPVNGDHQGAAPQRDFVLMSPASLDKDLNAKPTFDQLVAMSTKASNTPHPAVLSLWKADSDFAPGFAQQGETDWVLQAKLGDTAIAIILIGIASA